MTDKTYTEFEVNNETFRVRKDMLAAEPELVHDIAMLEKQLVPSPTTQGEMVDERQYWLNLYPIITPAQQEKLRKIMQNKATKLHLIDLKFGRVTS